LSGRGDAAPAPDRVPGRTVGQRDVVVAASGNLANVYLTASDGRMTWEALEAAQPGLVAALASHPGIGLVLVRSESLGPVVLGGGGVRHLATGHVTGADPLAPFGPLAEASLRRLDGFSTVGDLALISMLDADTGEVAAFEELVGSHGGLGGAQTEAFLLYPAELAPPADPLVGAPAVHAVLVGWLEAMGLREAPGTLRPATVPVTYDRPASAPTTRRP
jgi:hypothetical protein